MSDAPAPTRAEEGRETDEAEAMAEIASMPPLRMEAPLPIPVRKRFYLTKCPNCDWTGSSEQCGTDHGPWGDSDVHCPVCFEAGCEDDPSEEDAAEHGEQVMQRITQAEAEVTRLTAENERLRIAFHDATRRPLGVTPDSGAEFYDQRMADEAEERRVARSRQTVLRGLSREEAEARAAALGDAQRREHDARRGGADAP